MNNINYVGAGMGNVFYPGQYPNPAGDNARAPTNMTPQLSTQFDGNTEFNPPGRGGRYQPPQRRQNLPLDPIVRPESSASNASSSFRSQVSYMPPNSNYQMPPRGMNAAAPLYVGQPQQSRGYQQPSMVGLGAGLAGLRLDTQHLDNQFQYQPSPISSGNRNVGLVRRDSKFSTASSDPTSKPPSRTSSTKASTGTSRALAEIIKAGATEDLYDRSLSRYDTPAKLAAPTLGPARFNESKMFSSSSRQAVIPDTADASPAPAPRELVPCAVPDWLNSALTEGYRPSIDQATDSIPFNELYRGVSPPTTGLMRIKDIPYATTRPEIVAFVGRNAQVARLPEGSPYHAVHIMMERESGKTMDCFVEFQSPGEANWVTRQFANRVGQGRPPKVGDRPVEVSYASHDELLRELFPRAKHVQWSNGQPIVDTTVRQYYSGQNAEGFAGFIHPEEFNQLKKHAGLSDRSPFASRSPCRVYEHMITTLWKFPWYAVDHITLADRRNLYECTCALLRILIEHIRRPAKGFNPLEPTKSLLQELVVAALSCPGFSEKQKSTIVAKLYEYDFRGIAHGAHTNVKLGGHYSYSGYWPFAVISPVPGTDPSLLEYYAALLRHAAPSPPSSSLSLAAKMAAQASGQKQDPLGKISASYGPKINELTLAQAAEIEWAEFDRLLKKVCLPKPQTLSPTTPSSNSDTGHGFVSGITTRNGNGSSSNSSGQSFQFYNC